MDPDPAEAALSRAAQPTRDWLARLAEDKSPRVRAMLAEIAKRHVEPGFSVKRLSQAVGADKRLRRQFAAEVGAEAGEVLRQCRLETTARLLRDTPYQVESTALLAGYDSKRTFERACSEQFGCSPAVLRQCLREAKSNFPDLPDEVFSWYFWNHYDLRPLPRRRMARTIEYLEHLFSPSDPRG